MHATSTDGVAFDKYEGKLSFRPVSEVEIPRHSPNKYSQIQLDDGEKFAFNAGDNIHYFRNS